MLCVIFKRVIVQLNKNYNMMNNTNNPPPLCLSFLPTIVSHQLMNVSFVYYQTPLLVRDHTLPFFGTLPLFGKIVSLRLLICITVFYNQINVKFCLCLSVSSYLQIVTKYYDYFIGNFI